MAGRDEESGSLSELELLADRPLQQGHIVMAQHFDCPYLISDILGRLHQILPRLRVPPLCGTASHAFPHPQRFPSLPCLLPEPIQLAN